MPWFVRSATAAIVFSGRSATGFDLYIMRTDGTNLHQVTDTLDIFEGDADWAVAAQ